MKPLLYFLLLLLFTVPVAAQDKDIEENERKVLEEIFRTSDQPGQTPVSRHDRNKKTKRMSAPKGAFRIGCVCMDESKSDTRSGGACSGHGGVRFWVYRTLEGDTVHILTGRHERHPHALNAQEMSELSQKQAEKVKRLQQSVPVQSLSPAPVVVMPAPVSHDGFDWRDMVMVSVGGVAAFFIIRLVLYWATNNQDLAKYALRTVLRHRKRPVARPRRQAIREKRVPSDTKVRVRRTTPVKKRPPAPPE